MANVGGAASPGAGSPVTWEGEVGGGSAAPSAWVKASTCPASTGNRRAAILTPPFYFQIPDEMLHQHFADVAAAGVLPVVVYNNPLYTGNNLSPTLIAALMEVDGIVGLKQSNDDLGQLVESLRLAEGGGRALCTGIDSQFYAALCIGASGIFSTAAAIVPGPLVHLYELVQEGDHESALAQHRALQPLNRFLEYDPGYVSPTKEALRMLGLDCGPVRRPLPDFPPAERPALHEALQGLGVLEHGAVA